MNDEVVRESSGTLADYSVREVGRAILKELDMLRNRIAELEAEVINGHELQDSYCDRIAELSPAVGLMTTLKPTMVMDAEHPLEMAIEVVEHVTARIAELEAEKSILEDQQREAKNILIDKKLQIDSLYEEGYKMQQRIADLEFELSAMKDAGDVMHERLATLSTFGVRTPDGVKEAMIYWANSVQAGDVNG